MSISPLRRIIALAVLGSTLLVPTAILDTASAADAPCVVTFGSTDARAIPDPGTLELADARRLCRHGHGRGRRGRRHASLDQDLVIEFRHGSFTIALATRLGGAGDNYTGTTFDDEATSSITTASAPFSGRSRPQTPLSSFDSATASGEWALSVRDEDVDDAGTLNSFRVTITIADCDSDADGVKNSVDNCDLVANSSQVDTDKDGEGDLCDSDNDGDAVPDATDNCDFVVNPSQVDFDHDGIGDACDADRDGDALVDAVDNCNSVPNPDQLNTDADALGDACDAGRRRRRVRRHDRPCRLLAAAGHSGCPLATRNWSSRSVTTGSRDE